MRFDHLIKQEIDKRAVRRLCSDLRVLYFEPTGIIGQVRNLLANPPKERDRLFRALSSLRHAYNDEEEEVSKSIERVGALKARDNLEIDLDLFELAWKVRVSKGQSRSEIGSALRYLLNDFDHYWNNVEEVKRRLQIVVGNVDRLNAEITALESELKART